MGRDKDRLNESDHSQVGAGNLLEYVTAVTKIKVLFTQSCFCLSGALAPVS
jgi:hypothetical protein